MRGNSRLNGILMVPLSVSICISFSVCVYGYVLLTADEREIGIPNFQTTVTLCTIKRGFGWIATSKFKTTLSVSREW